jgi:hypothetical protein
MTMIGEVPPSALHISETRIVTEIVVIITAAVVIGPIIIAIK